MIRDLLGPAELRQVAVLFSEFGDDLPSDLVVGFLELGLIE